VLAAQEEGKVVEFSTRCFESYWSDGQDISQTEVLTQVCAAAGLNALRILARAQNEAIKGLLRANTDEVIARGGFGSPTMFVNGTDMYFGNDRMELVEAALTR
jgi:2-hydroxychromene-2-carboxylate isomerase